MAQKTGSPPYETEMFISTYRFPSQTWFLRRIAVAFCLIIIGAVAASVLNPIVGVIIFLSGGALGFYVFEKGYRLGRDDGRWGWGSIIPIDTPIEDRQKHYRRAFHWLSAFSALLLIGPWVISLAASAWNWGGWMFLLVGPTLLLTWIVGINCVQQAVYCRRAYLALADTTR
ncbi:MAG: hypothetical protein OEM29_02285 [Thermoplasmata archaeon]|nr:hypothetical protein [Thermoplasmata archaeon]